MKKLLAIFVLLAFILPLSPSEAETKAIGVIVPLSGPVAEYGTAFRNGVALAAATDCSFVFEDSKYDPKVAVTAFHRLVDETKTHLVYNFGGATTEPLAPLAESRRVVLLTSESEPRFSIGKQFVIRFNSPSEAHATVLIDEFNRRGYGKIGVVRTDNQYMHGIYRALTVKRPQTVQFDEVSVVLQGETDFRPILLRLTRSRYDAVGVLLFPGQISSFYRQMAQLGISVPTFGTDFFESSSEVTASGAAIEGAVFPNNFVTAEFRKMYVDKHGNDSQIQWAGFGYDFAALSEKTVCSSSATGVEDILRSLKSASGTGVTGQYRYIETKEGDKYFNFPLVLRKIQDLKPTTEIMR